MYNQHARSHWLSAGWLGEAAETNFLAKVSEAVSDGKQRCAFKVIGGFYDKSCAIRNEDVEGYH